MFDQKEAKIHAGVLLQLRTLGSLLISAGFAQEDYQDWAGICTAGEMVVSYSEAAMDQLDSWVASEEKPIQKTNLHEGTS